MDTFNDEKNPDDINENIVVVFTETEYNYIKNLLHENYKLMCKFPKSKRTPQFYLFENILKCKFELK